MNVLKHPTADIILSGAVHYFRVLKSDYADRLAKLRACGLNTVETYVAWNIHEGEKGRFVFDGHFDLAAYLTAARDLGLAVILRPGPYICAEWDFGGLPAWLLKDANLRLRCFDPAYLRHVDDWFDHLVPYILPFLSTRGGPIIGMQVENEYGSYGDDKRYLEHIRAGLVRRGVDVCLFTSDGGTDFMLTGGTLPGVYKTVNFGSGAQRNFEKLREFQSNAPLFCMEFWDGWFDHWGEKHHTRSAKDVMAETKAILDSGGQLNFYMFHGGTNFGFYNGANLDGAGMYQPTVTSYDYCAPLDEAGDPTETYTALRGLLQERFGPIPYAVPPASAKAAYGEIPLAEAAPLFSNLDRLSTPTRSAAPLPMEAFDQAYGYILYSMTVEGKREELPLKIIDLRDRAQIFVDGVPWAVYYRNESQDRKLKVPPQGLKLDILVENMGRVNYGALFNEAKGIGRGVTLGDRFLFDYSVYPLSMEDLSGLRFGTIRSNGATDAPGAKNAPGGARLEAQASAGPCFYRARLRIDEARDTFLDYSNLNKGFVMVNGFNIGRYWNIGPGSTLFIPKGLLMPGDNEIIVFEQQGLRKASIVFTDTADLG